MSILERMLIHIMLFAATIAVSALPYYFGQGHGTLFLLTWALVMWAFGMGFIHGRR